MPLSSLSSSPISLLELVARKHVRDNFADWLALYEKAAAAPKSQANNHQILIMQALVNDEIKTETTQPSATTSRPQRTPVQNAVLTLPSDLLEKIMTIIKGHLRA